MADTLIRLTYDPTGRSPDNLITAEPHILRATTGFPYKIITLDNGGFYVKGLQVFDQDYNRLVWGTDYIVTYLYKHRSETVGQKICGAIVFLDPVRAGTVYVNAQMVGGNIAFSLTVIRDYVEFYNAQPTGYIPKDYDYAGNEPTWLPGELDRERWHLDTYQPLNNEIYMMSRSIQGGTGNYESDYRNRVIEHHNQFIDRFTDRLERHIADKQNPHVDTKTQIGLGLMNNFSLATVQQARQAAANNLYLTPSLGFEIIDELAVKPTREHIGNKNNPHRTTPVSIGAPTKAVVSTELDKKYGINEQVANSTNILNTTGEPRSANQLVDEGRTNIPAGNFVAENGNYLSPARLAGSTPTASTVLRNDGNWVDFAAMVAAAGGSGKPDLMVMNVDPNTHYLTAFNMAVALPWAQTAPVGSLILYNLNITYQWATYIVYTITHVVCYGAIKTPNGWVNIVSP